MTEATTGYDVFLSHASENKPDVRRFVAQLRRAGVSVWLDEERLPPGHDAKQAIETGLRQSRHVILWVTKEWLKKRWTQWELMVFADLPTGRGVIPVMNMDWDHLKLGPYLTWQARIPMGLTPEQRLWLTLCGIRGAPPGDFADWSRWGAEAMGMSRPEAASGNTVAPAHAAASGLVTELPSALTECLAVARDPAIPPSDAASELIELGERAEKLIGKVRPKSEPWRDVIAQSLALLERIVRETTWRRDALANQVPGQDSLQRMTAVILERPTRDAKESYQKLEDRLKELGTAWPARLQRQGTEQVVSQLHGQGVELITRPQALTFGQGRVELSSDTRSDLFEGYERAFDSWANNLNAKLVLEHQSLISETSRVLLAHGQSVDLDPVGDPKGVVAKHRLSAPPSLEYAEKGFWARASMPLTRNTVVALALVGGGISIALQLAGATPLAVLVAATTIASGVVVLSIRAEQQKSGGSTRLAAQYEQLFCRWWKDELTSAANRYQLQLTRWTEATLEKWKAAIDKWWSSVIEKNLVEAQRGVAVRSKELEGRSDRILQEVGQLEEAVERLASIQSELQKVHRVLK